MTAIPFRDISMDILSGLPSIKGYDSLFVCIDRFSKMCHIAPISHSITAKQLADVFFATIYKHHGLPTTIITDRDSKFTSHFWQSLFSALQTKLHMSTAYHPQTDGQTEVTNRILLTILKHYTNKQADNWLQLLPFIEFAHNNSYQASTGFTPF